MQACNPERNHQRFYCIEAYRDLFDDIIVRIHYGRIGSKGRIKSHIAQDEDEAKKRVRKALSRRQSAPKRIGVPYLVVAKSDPEHWAD